MVFIFSAPFLLAQNSEDKTVYLDSLWKETTQENHVYYRIIKAYYVNADSYQISDYYKSGTLQMKGTFVDREAVSRIGEFIYYYENGNKKILLNYIKSRPVGKYTSWYENGNKQLEGEYFENTETFTNDVKIIQFWDSNKNQTVLNSNGYYDSSSTESSAKGLIKDGLKNGTWSGFEKFNTITYTEEYANGKLISGKSINGKNEENQYDQVEIRPSPKKGINHFYNYVGKKFNISKEAYINKIGGKIILTFTVEKDGHIDNIKVVKALGYGLDEEAIRVLENYRDWNPGKIRGNIVSVLFSIPITIMPAK